MPVLLLARRPLEFAKGEKSGIKDSLVFSVKRFWSYFWCPLTPVLGVLFLYCLQCYWRPFGQIKIAGEIAVAIGFPLAILSGFLIVFIGVIGIIGFFLMYPTISAEGSDTFDAMSRAYSYVLSRPRTFPIIIDQYFNMLCYPDFLYKLCCLSGYEDYLLYSWNRYGR